MPLELVRDFRETLGSGDLLGVSPSGSSFPKESTNIPPKFAAVLKWQTWDSTTESHLVDRKIRSHLRLYIDGAGNLVRQPNLLLVYQTNFRQNNDILYRWPLNVDPDDIVISHYSIRYVTAPNQALSVTAGQFLTGVRVTVFLQCNANGESITTPEQVRTVIAEELPYIETAHAPFSNRTGIVPAMDWIVFTSIQSDNNLYDPLFLTLKWEGIFLNCWTKWKITLQHNVIGTNIPSVTELPYFTHQTMSQTPQWSENEALYKDITNPFYVPKYWGQQPRPWDSSMGVLHMQPPQFYDCRRYLFGNFMQRTYTYVPEPEYTGNPWHDMAWPRWLKAEDKPPVDKSILARADPTEPTDLPPHKWFKGGSRFRILPCTIDIEGTAYPNKFFKGPAFGVSKAKLEIIHVTL